MSSTNLLDRPVAGRARANPKLACALTLGLVFLCGTAVGALGMNLGIHRSIHKAAFESGTGRARYFERMQKELDLTPAQSEQIGSILNDFWELYHTVLSDGKQRIEQQLTEPQKRKFESLLQQQLLLQQPPGR